MRSSYLVCYDICDEKRLRKVFQAMRGYGDHLQFSVFECQLTAMDLARCRAELGAIIQHHCCPANDLRPADKPFFLRELHGNPACRDLNGNWS
jgi:CRISPR-associated protein Cas2